MANDPSQTTVRDPEVEAVIWQRTGPREHLVLFVRPDWNRTVRDRQIISASPPVIDGMGNRWTGNTFHV